MKYIVLMTIISFFTNPSLMEHQDHFIQNYFSRIHKQPEGFIEQSVYSFRGGDESIKNELRNSPVRKNYLIFSLGYMKNKDNGEEQIFSLGIFTQIISLFDAADIAGI